jgi:hypothetical protein
MPVPDFSPGEVLTAAAMDSIGLWLVKTQTVGAGVSSVIVTDAFSATYNNYLVVGDNIQFSALNDSVFLQMRVGSTTANTNYFYALGYWTYGGVAAVAASNNGPSFNNMARSLGAGDRTSFAITINGPFLTQKTTVGAWVTGTDLTGSGSGYHNQATSYNQCVFSTLAGSMTGGTIRVYGLRN